MSIELLCIGDVHLGRQPTRLNNSVLEHYSPTQLGPAAALARAVDLAVSTQVDAVLFAGDVVEQADDFYEAYGDLEAAVRRLSSAGIPTFAVAGNHDTLVLPRLADAIEGLRLVGRHGQWEALTVDGRSGGSVRILGWSFASRQVTSNPLDNGILEALAANPAGSGKGVLATLGLLHCDRDQTGSVYAPVSSASLERAPVDAWLLGHIHKPDRLEGSRPAGYLGSLSALHPGERGARGAWKITVDGPGAVRAAHVPLAPMRYERIQVEVTGRASLENIDSSLLAAMQGLRHQLESDAANPLAVACRVDVTGRGAPVEELEAWRRSAHVRDLHLFSDTCCFFVESLHVRYAPLVKLEALAVGNDPAGAMARTLITLARSPDDPERVACIKQARAELEQHAYRPEFAGLRPPALSDEAVAERLEAAGTRALEMLLQQRHGDGLDISATGPNAGPGPHPGSASSTAPSSTAPTPGTGPL